MSSVIAFYDRLREATDEETRARVIAEALEQMEQRYPEVTDLATKSALRETELCLRKDIEELRGELKRNIEALRGEVKRDIEQLRGEVQQQSPTGYRAAEWQHAASRKSLAERDHPIQGRDHQMGLRTAPSADRHHHHRSEIAHHRLALRQFQTSGSKNPQTIPDLRQLSYSRKGSHPRY